MANFFGCLGHPSTHNLFRVLSPYPQTPFQLRYSWRQHKDTGHVVSSMLSELLRPLPINIEDDVLTTTKCFLNRFPWCAIGVAKHLRMLQQLTLPDHCFEPCLVDEKIIPSINLAASRWSSRH